VSAGFGTRVERNGVPLAPVRLLPPPDLSAIAGTNTAPQLSVQWPPVAGAVRYRVQLAPDPDFHTILADADPTAAQVTLALPSEGNFWLRIRSIDQLGLEGPDATKAITQHIVPPPPVLATPRPGARIVGATASFSWSNTGVGLHYRWQLARDTEFTSLVMEREIDGATSVEVDGMEPGHYLWRVATIDANGEIGDWSAPQDYIQRPSPPIVETPVVTRRGVELRWQGPPATRYHVQIARDAAFARPVIDRVVDVAQLSVPHLRSGTYYVRVQISDSDEVKDPFGPPQKFEVPIPLWIRIAVPIAGAVLIGLLS
jgi:hypothetical protein